MTEPLVSVVMPCYNHEEFVAHAIESVLAQEGVSFELLVEDDGSTDGSAAVVSAIDDPRLSFLAKPRNEGASATVNRLIRRCRGEFVALINSDDVWPRKDKLARQVEVLRRRPELAATFGQPSFIRADGQPLEADQTYSAAVFAAANRTKAQWLRYFWEQPNCLCHPTILMRRSAYEEMGGYDNRLRQIPDLDLWVRLVKRHEIHIDEEVLVLFRLLDGRNASALSTPNLTRAMNEHMLLFERYFDGLDAAMLIDSFGDVLANPRPSDGLQVRIESALLYLRGSATHGAIQRTIGLGRMYALLGNAEAAAALRDYGIDDAWLHREMARFTPFLHTAAAPAAPAPATPSVASVAGRTRTSQGLLARYVSLLRR